VNADRIAAAAGNAALTQFDVNKDGALDAVELEKSPGLQAGLAATDKNQDGKLSAEEINARVQTWGKSGVGRMMVSCVVTKQQQPLSGATVKLVPELFLGSGLQAAQGVTDAQGQATLNATGDVGGASPGFYRVEITTADNSIPASFNSETKLGVEIAADNPNLLSGALKFEIR
jgi:hypothetical protein